MAFIEDLKRNLPSDVTVVVQMPTVDDILGKSAEEVYKEQPALRAVVDFISSNVAQLPIHCYKRKEDNDRQRDTTGRLAQLLTHPNPTMTQYELIDRLVHDYELFGWALWYVIPSRNMPCGWEIDPIPVAWIHNTPTTDGFSPAYYEVTNPATKKTTKLPAADCIRFASYNPSNPSSALSPVDALKTVLAEQISSYTFRNQQWKNGGRFNSYVKRPADAPDWSPQARSKFIEALKQRFSGNYAKDAGGMALLEDGMTIETTQFSSRDAEWAEATRLSREDVAGVYHVNPAMIWSNEGQTYASVKENARSLYSDTLGPILRMIEDRINTFLIPLISAPSNEYVEFNIQAKLAGSFEEQADALTSAVGAPYMSREEARARMNLPRLDDQDLDKVITPLNVIAGRVSSFESLQDRLQDAQSDTESDETPDDSAKARLFETEDNKGLERDTKAQTVIELKAADNPELEEELLAFFQKFFKRQEKSFLNDISKARAQGLSDAEIAKRYKDIKLDRWNKELKEDLYSILSKHSSSESVQILESLGFERDFVESFLDAGKGAIGYLDNWTDNSAVHINTKTIEQVIRALDPSDNPFSKDDLLCSTVDGVFEYAKEARSAEYAERFTTVNNSISRVYAVKDANLGHKAVKIWRSSGHNTRKSHMAMNGEMVDFYEEVDQGGYIEFQDSKFSNGQRFPGDYLAGQPGEVAGCRCRMDIRVTK